MIKKSLNEEEKCRTKYLKQFEEMSCQISQMLDERDQMRMKCESDSVTKLEEDKLASLEDNLQSELKKQEDFKKHIDEQDELLNEILLKESQLQEECTKIRGKYEMNLEKIKRDFDQIARSSSVIFLSHQESNSIVLNFQHLISLLLERRRHERKYPQI